MGAATGDPLFVLDPKNRFRLRSLLAHFGEAHLARGRRLMDRKAVSYGEWEADGVLVCQVKAKQTHTVRVRPAVGLDAECDCGQKKVCAHRAAVCLSLAVRPAGSPEGPGARTGRQVSWQLALHRAVEQAERPVEPAPEAVRLIFRLEIAPDGTPIIETHKAQPGPNGPVGESVFGLAGSWGHDPLEPKEKFLTLADVALCRILRQYPVDGHKKGTRTGGGFRFQPPMAARYGVLMALMRGGRLYEKGGTQPLMAGPSRQVTPVVEDVLPDETPADGWMLKLSGVSVGTTVIAGEPPLYIEGHTIGSLMTPLPGSLAALLTTQPVHIPAGDRAEFLTYWVPRLSAYSQVSLPPGLAPRRVKGVKPTPRITLRDDVGELTLEPEFVYGEAPPVAALSTLEPMAHREDEAVAYVRDATAEALYIARLLTPKTEGLEKPSATGPGRWAYKGDNAYDFLLTELPQLAAEGWEAFGEASLTDHRIYRGKSRMTGRIRSGIDWFDLKMEADFDGARMAPEKLLAAWEAGRRFVRLPDGQVARIPDWVRDRAQALEEAGLSKKEEARLSAFQVPLLLELTAGVALDADADFRKAAEKLQRFDGIAAVAPPAGLKATLRPYQKDGLAWLEFLREYGFHGILADDMGLGKTIQVLALLLLEKQRGHLDKPSLVVVPTSLIFNWAHEIKRFAPDLTVTTWHGPDRFRGQAKLTGVDIVLTNYALVRQDLARFEKMDFHYLVLDEAQYVKNPDSQVSHAVRQLIARHRLSLTGTPLENHLGELWSQFAYLMPGFLGTSIQFRRRFGAPIERGEDDAARKLLGRVRPFILRRTKDQVATELPERVETTLLCRLEGEQRELYEQIRDLYRTQVAKSIQSKGLSRSRITILDALLKLRQVCCDPALLPAGLAGEVTRSAKMELFVEFLTEALEEGHRLLVFSQFVSMLTRIRGRLDAAGIAYSYLDGRTRNREKKVRDFQENPDIPVFLISLKAGGTGLNLTGADYVVHFDPWWNPAVEQQATDRAHRIGQTRKVFSYKLIAEDTVEEKIVALQEKKRSLSNLLMGGEKELVADLSLDDLERIFGDLDL